MRYTHVFYIFLAIALLGVFGLQAAPTGFITYENLTLIHKLKPPCFCDNKMNISAQQEGYYSLVASAENAVARKDVSEEFAIKLLNRYAEKSCEKCY